jgi:hypothetical protein
MDRLDIVKAPMKQEYFYSKPALVWFKLIKVTDLPVATTCPGVSLAGRGLKPNVTKISGEQAPLALPSVESLSITLPTEYMCLMIVSNRETPSS